MAAVVGRAVGQPLFRASNARITQQKNMSTLRNLSKGKKLAVAIGGVAATVAGVATASIVSVHADEDVLHPPHFPWYHNAGIFNSIDMQSARRGYEVYKQVCAACHSMDRMHYRELVGEIMTKERAKKEAAEAIITDGPDAEGNMFTRPGKLFDHFPAPYPNDKAAAAANGGAVPPDLSVITRARLDGEDYIFSLLTGYCDPPAGIKLEEGQHFNPYFKGGAIAMAKALYNEIIEYEDGTPATESQLAKDVVTFLKWSTEYEHNIRKEYAIKIMILLGTLGISTFFLYKHKFSYLKTKNRIMLKKDPTRLYLKK